MGKWNRRNYARPSRRRYYDYQWSPPRDEPCPDPETEVWQDNVPMWEKKFCYLVGRMPWKKVLSTKNFMNCHTHSNILSWDDSAGKEAFLTAKQRFWQEFNGLPSDSQLPDPDMYIDQIDWNPYIDPDLSRECDKVFFNPDDKYFLSKDNGWPDDIDVQDSKEKYKTFGWGPRDDVINHGNKSNDDDPWESHNKPEIATFEDKSAGWNQWDNSGNYSSNLNANNNDPWEKHRSQTPGFEVKDNSWGVEWNKSWISNSKPNEYLNDNKDPWASQGNRIRNDNSWGRSWNSIPNEFSYTPNKCSGWTDSNSGRKESWGWRDRGESSGNWRQEGREVKFTSYWSEKNNRNGGERMPNNRGNKWGQKGREKYNWGPKDSINIHRGQGQGNRKREGSDYYVANYKGPRLQGDGQSSYHRDGGRVSFGS